MTVSDIIFSYVCPSLGCILSAAMYSAAVPDLQEALSAGSLGSLNPIPWAIMTGNTVGWCAYGYYNHDPFMLASNFPGLVLSVWLNMGAAKLQYQDRIRLRNASHEVLDNNSDNNITDGNGEAGVVESSEMLAIQRDDSLQFVPQETLLLRVLVVWILILILVGWSGLFHTVEGQINAIGILVNINLIFFYGAPLQTIQTVLRSKSSDSIHRPTMIMNSTNAIFWVAYGVKRNDPYIFGPNTIGFLLGFAQIILLCCYDHSSHTAGDQGDGLLLDEENDLEEPLLAPEQHALDGNDQTGDD
ncbi:unnamed protein product [Cylindrotheca closterium]|uniref:Sugar transporter SWEET1 n=1 Tax=Cylindrotheca closterium TaxID=2856 RepID=A0AAD2FUW5_9STRA|nr:unnamed protein product [Cylindrotheca closterium]